MSTEEFNHIEANTDNDTLKELSPDQNPDFMEASENLYQALRTIINKIDSIDEFKMLKTFIEKHKEELYYWHYARLNQVMEKRIYNYL